MLYIISLGLGDERDISVAGLEALRKCDKVYLEDYTSVLQCSKQDLEQAFGKKIELAGRDVVETEADHTILAAARTGDAALLVVGDAVTATTHIDLLMRAKERGIKVKVFHNASIVSAIGITGLQVYKFGKITSIPFENSNVETPYNVLQTNKKVNMHTLFLLDLDPAEQRFMSIPDAVRYLLKVELRRGEKVFSESTPCVGCARVGTDSTKIVYCTAKKLLETDFGRPPYCLIVPGELHFMEEEALKKLN